MFLEKYINDIRNLCQKNKVKNLYVFGSVLTDSFTDKSDIDLIVDIDSNDPLDYANQSLSLDKQFVFRIFVNICKQPNLVITAYKTSRISKYYEDKI